MTLFKLKWFLRKLFRKIPYGLGESTLPISIVVNDAVPNDELWFLDNDKLVGKITNVANAQPRGQEGEGE